MRPRIFGPLAVLLLCATAALAQVNYAPTPPPDTAANDRSWYRDGDPIPFAGDLYYQTGPTVYFNGNTMVPTGSYDGVTLYADTTLEPYSMVFVPVGGNLLRPYAALRAAHLAGTAGSRVPAFAEEQRPTRRQRERIARPPEPPIPPEEREMNRPFEERGGGLLMETVRKPQDNAGMWVSFRGRRWMQAGESTILDPARLTRVGEYYGLPVYADAATPYVVYIPFRGNVVAPFRRASGE